MLAAQTHIALGAEAWGPALPLSRLVPSCRLAPRPALRTYLKHRALKKQINHKQRQTSKRADLILSGREA